MGGQIEDTLVVIEVFGTEVFGTALGVVNQSYFKKMWDFFKWKICIAFCGGFLYL